MSAKGGMDELEALRATAVRARQMVEAAQAAHDDALSRRLSPGQKTVRDTEGTRRELARALAYLRDVRRELSRCLRDVDQALHELE